MIIYLDENLPKHLAQGFHILQYPEGKKTGFEIEVKYIPDVFTKGAKDEDWIPKAGSQKACIITQDRNIHKRKHELELYRKYKLGFFFLKGKNKKQGLNVWQMVESLAKNWPAIIEKAQTDTRPFAYEISIKGKLKKLK
ncbi:MAG: hypothetical protein M3421_04205 [Bacteroidota bacterium]|nr:hypothetical protein [Bacteroidota bacterium]